MIAARLAQLEGTIDKYGNLADSLKQVDLKPTLVKTNTLLDNLNTTVEKLQSEDGTLGRLMTEDSLYVALQKTVENLDKLLIHFDENPKDFLAPLGRSKKKIDKARVKDQEN